MSELEDLPIISQKEFDKAYQMMLTVCIPSNQAKVLAKFAERCWLNEEFAIASKEAFESGDYIKLQKIIESEKSDYIKLQKIIVSEKRLHNYKRIKCYKPFLLIWNKIKEWFS